MISKVEIWKVARASDPIMGVCGCGEPAVQTHVGCYCPCHIPTLKVGDLVYYTDLGGKVHPAWVSRIDAARETVDLVRKDDESRGWHGVQAGAPGTPRTYRRRVV